MAEQLHASLPNAQIQFLPTAGNPFKHTQTHPEHRLAMLRLALRDTSFQINRCEIFAAPPTYTVDTLQNIRQQITAERPLIFVMGHDSLVKLPHWKGGLSLLNLTHLWVFPRPDQSNTATPDWVLAKHCHDPQQLQHQASGLIYIDQRIPPAISSSQIRQAPHRYRALVPQRVWAYNQRAHLYGFANTDD